jgi:excisionase family DNA binding protein
MNDAKKGAMSVAEMAEYLGIGRSMAYEQIRQGKIPAIRIGGRWIIPKSELENWLRRNQGLGGDDLD